MALESALAEIGLSKNKGRVYLTALGLGTATAEDIAKQVGLPRTTVHELLQHLLAMGLVSFVTRGRTRLYTPEAPEKLKKLLQEKERKIERALPELNALVNTRGLKPKVRFYEGVGGIKTVFDDTLTVSNKILRGILSMEDLYKVPGKEFMDSYVGQRIMNGIKLKVIRSEVKDVEESWASSNLELRELHYAPAGIIFPMTMYLYDNKVGIIGTQRENFGMIIESADFYQTQKNFFEVLWEVGKVGKKKD